MTSRDPAFAELPLRAQTHRLRTAAIEALDRYPIEVRRLRLLNHDYNTTFRVDTADHRRFALRLNMNERKTTANLDAEMAWLHALDADTDVVVPAPLTTRDGRLYTSVPCAAVGRDLPVAVMSWLPGRDLDEPTPEALLELGRITAELHEHAEGWKLPRGAALPSHAGVLVGEPPCFDDDHPELDNEARSIIHAALDAAQAATDLAFDGLAPHALHADLHPWNVKWLRGRMSVFDFDDAVIGVPVQDLAISIYYLRDDEACRDALLDGYAGVRSLPDGLDSAIEPLLAGRNLILLNDVLSSEHAGIIEIKPAYMANSITKLRSFLDTGRYRHDVPGLVPISL